MDESRDADTIWVQSLVSSRTGEPLVNIHWGENAAQMTVDEAITHALGIIEAAHAATSDAAVAKVLGGIDQKEAGMMMLALREARPGGGRFTSHREAHDAPHRET